MSEHVVLRKEGAIAWLVLNRPEKRNAMSLAMWQRLPDLLADVERDPDVKVLVLRGADARAFSAGADISEFEALRSTPQDARRYNDSNERAEHALLHLTKPTIALVQGACIGGGCGLAVACDLRFCDDTARFGITPAKLGIVYSLQATKALIDVVGPSHAKELLFTGLHVPADRALHMGLVNAIVPAAELESHVTDIALTIASRAQSSVRATKRITRLILDGLADDDHESRRLRTESFTSQDYREGVRAFLEKRPANFTSP